MRYVELIPGIRSSILGFGCAPVLGAVAADRARIAIRTALDAGVTHFDLARSYGYGEAERFVGRELRGMRDEVVIVTKFGIAATATATVLRPFKPLLRAMRGRTAGPGPNPATPFGGGRLGRLLHRRLPITAATMRSSLEKSLRALGTDRVEFLLVHEPEELSRAPELAACAEDLKRAGKIRGWGLASLHGSPTKPPSASNVWQTNVPPAGGGYDRLRSTACGLILFSPLSGVAATNRVGRLRQLWADFPRAVVLCSMFTPDHIRNNAASIS